MHLQCRKPGFDPWVGKIPWRREWLPTLVFWPGEFHGLYSPWGGKESDTTEQLSLHLHSQRCPSFPFCGHRRGRHLLETIPWTEEPGGLSSMGSLRVGHNWATSLSLFTFMHWSRKWQPTPVFLPGESQGWGRLVGCVYGVAQSRTRLKRLSSSSSSSDIWARYRELLYFSWREALHCFFLHFGNISTFKID